MGYESRIYIAEEHKWNSDGSSYFETIASLDLSKAGSLSEVFTRRINSNDQFYGMCEKALVDGVEEERILEDFYGSRLGIAPIEDVLKRLRSLNKTNHYRRFDFAIALLNHLLKSQKDGNWDNLVCLHLGY